MTTDNATQNSPAVEIPFFGCAKCGACMKKGVEIQGYEAKLIEIRRGLWLLFRSYHDKADERGMSNISNQLIGFDIALKILGFSHHTDNTKF